MSTEKPSMRSILGHPPLHAGIIACLVVVVRKHERNVKWQMLIGTQLSEQGIDSIESRIWPTYSGLLSFPEANKGVLQVLHDRKHLPQSQ